MRADGTVNGGSCGPGFGCMQPKQRKQRNPGVGRKLHLRPLQNLKELHSSDISYAAGKHRKHVLRTSLGVVPATTPGPSMPVQLAGILLRSQAQLAPDQTYSSKCHSPSSQRLRHSRAMNGTRPSCCAASLRTASASSVLYLRRHPAAATRALGSG